MSDIATKEIVYQISDMNKVEVQHDIVYHQTDSDVLTLDLYSPAVKTAKPFPVVIFVFGFKDAMFGNNLKKMQQYISWGKLIAASGMAAITYTYKDPITDFSALLYYLKKNSASLGIDEKRMGLWACSGNVPMALSVLMQESKEFKFNCAALSYGYMLDSEEAAKQFGFVNPCLKKKINEIAEDLPLFIVRCGQDQMPNLNETIDRFIAEALAHNLTVTFINHRNAPHCYDLFDDSLVSREIIKSLIGFFRFNFYSDF